LVFAIGLLVQALSWLLVLLGGSPWLAAVGLVGLGFASNALSVVGGATRQRLTPDDKLGASSPPPACSASDPQP
jgi:hypothetical protein